MRDYPFHHVGKWEKDRLMKPHEFLRERIVGEVTITLPAPPTDITQIINYDKPIKKQKWEKVPPPDFRGLTDEQQKDYLKQEIHRRNNGVFIYIHGGIEYLTGVHYWLLQNWIIDGMDMEFRDSQRDSFYFWKYCEDDPECFGEAYFTNRRSGKTEEGMGIIFEYATKTNDAHVGIQSKTNTDAANIFKKIIQRWKRVPKFWKPTDSGETNPKKALLFEEPGQRSTKGVVKKYKDVLNSRIDYMPSVEEAYDGYKLKRYYDDEFGKAPEINAYNRWDIVKPCLVVGTTIIGKSIHTTTVEELDRKGGKAALEFWNTSNPNERKADGRTVSGLYRLFKPAYYGFEGCIDEYGYSDVEAAKEKLLKQRDGLTGEKLAAEQRRFPFTPQEAFMNTTSGGVFPAHLINEQLIHNETLLEGTVRVGNFYWVNEQKKEVTFLDEPNGRWKVAWMPPVEKRNKGILTARGILPINHKEGGIGVDPYDHNRITSGAGSNGAIYVFKGADLENPLRSNCFVCEYVERQPLAAMFYDDVAKTAVFYGMEVLIEDNKPGCINWMEANGFKNYVAKTQMNEFSKSTSRNYKPGVSTSGEGAREALVNGLASYITHRIGRIEEKNQVEIWGIKPNEIIPNLHGFCPFERLLKDWSNFDVMKWTDYDAAVASMLAYMQSNRAKRIVQTEVAKATSIFTSFNISGNVSKPIKN